MAAGADSFYQHSKQKEWMLGCMKRGGSVQKPKPHLKKNVLLTSSSESRA
jgi:hypothetical protein